MDILDIFTIPSLSEEGDSVATVLVPDDDVSQLLRDIPLEFEHSGGSSSGHFFCVIA